MDWLTPLTNLFSSTTRSSTSLCEQQVAVRVNDCENVCKSYNSARRSSSLSDLQVVKDKRNSQLRSAPANNNNKVAHLQINQSANNRSSLSRSFCKLNDYDDECHLSLSLAKKGGSFGDMMNLKQYGSNRSLASMTSSIADVVPLETVQRKKNILPTQQQAILIESVDPPASPSADDQDQVFASSAISVIIEHDFLCQSDDNSSPLRAALNRKGRAHQLSVSDRAKRLSLLIQESQYRCSRHQDNAVNFGQLTIFSARLQSFIYIFLVMCPEF